MKLAAVLSVLVQMHVCLPTWFTAADGRSLEVVVCPMLEQAKGAPFTPATPEKPTTPHDAPLLGDLKKDGLM